MKTLSKLFFVLILLGSMNSFAQTKSQRQQFKEDSLEIVRVRLVRPQLKFDNRTIFSPQKMTHVSGFDVGVLLKEKLRLTLGYYSSNTKNINYLSEIYSQENFSNLYQLKYGSLNMEFIYKRTRFYSLGMPFEFGVGTNKISVYSRETGANTFNQKGGIALSYFGLSGTFTPIRWFGLRVSVGYRTILFNQLDDVEMGGFYASVGLAVDFREIIEDVQLYRLKKKYNRNFHAVGTGVDLITD